MDFKPFAKSAQAFEGQMTFWILPFTTPLQDTRQSRLDDIDPQFEYVNEKTGQVETSTPESYRKALIKARDMNAPNWQHQMTYGGWRARSRWGKQHESFLLYDTHTVEVDFALHDDAPADLRVFAAYWTGCADAALAERWQAFQYAVSERVIDAWEQAFNETRDNPTPGSAELGEAKPEGAADPNAPSDGDSPTSDTSA